MTTKPKTRKAPAAETGINPKLTSLAAKLDAAHRHAREVEALQKDADDIDAAVAAEDACATEYAKISKLEFKLAKIPATNIEELKLKARYADVELPDQQEWPGDGAAAAAASVVLDLRALDTPRPKHIQT